MHAVAHVDLDALIWNYHFLRDKSAPAATAAAIKANAYGLGIIGIAPALQAAGCRTFFVAHFSEALTLRLILPDAKTEIIVLHGIQPHDYAEALARHITPTLNHLGDIENWRIFARQQEIFLEACVHLDSGINRLGLPLREQNQLADNHGLLDGIKVRAWMSHFARSEEFDISMTREQRRRFIEILNQLPPAPASLCNSSGIFWGKDYVFDLTRPGIALYGGNPMPMTDNPMHAVLTLKAPILQIRDVVAGDAVGYTSTYCFTKSGRVATLPCGYADGYHRALANRGKVKIGDHLAPVIGNVSMDLLTVDVTDIPEHIAHVGAMATIIGPHRPIDQVAVEAQTNAYEILTSLGPRVERIYSRP